MPCYPALALLLGSAMAAGGGWVRRGTRVLAVVTGCAAVACILILVAVRNVPAPGDISQALSRHPSAYTLSLGHMEDLTLESFAYLRLPLAMAPRRSSSAPWAACGLWGSAPSWLPP